MFENVTKGTGEGTGKGTGEGTGEGTDELPGFVFLQIMQPPFWAFTWASFCAGVQPVPLSDK